MSSSIVEELSRTLNEVYVTDALHVTGYNELFGQLLTLFFVFGITVANSRGLICNERR